MVCMIADYKQDGKDLHCEYIAMTDDWERAVCTLSDKLHAEGLAVTQIAVILGDHTMEELKEISAKGPEPGTAVYIAVEAGPPGPDDFE